MLSSQTGMYDAYARGHVQPHRAPWDLLHFRYKRTGKVYTSVEISLFGVEVELETLEIKFEWMPMFAAWWRLENDRKNVGGS